jgi:tetrahydromethanopterin S-methyltransferase subunit G
MDLAYLNNRNIRILTKRIENLEKKVKFLERDKKIDPITGEWK